MIQWIAGPWLVSGLHGLSQFHSHVQGVLHILSGLIPFTGQWVNFLNIPSLSPWFRMFPRFSMDHLSLPASQINSWSLPESVILSAFAASQSCSVLFSESHEGSDSSPSAHMAELFARVSVNLRAYPRVSRKLSVIPNIRVVLMAFPSIYVTLRALFWVPEGFKPFPHISGDSGPSLASQQISGPFHSFPGTLGLPRIIFKHRKVHMIFWGFR